MEIEIDLILLRCSELTSVAYMERSVVGALLSKTLRGHECSSTVSHCCRNQALQEYSVAFQEFAGGSRNPYR
jgi:hypothetical protein